ncbi:MAG: DivIVA domain-containing protein [Coriobacteriales bacterium]|nr:DivIVA domain-containing protein [Coriobacteriales bacterium]
MAITKQDIDNVSLNIVNEGYDPEEVDLLLEHISQEVDSFNRALHEAAARIESADARALAAEAQATQSAQMAHSAQAAGRTEASEHQIAQALIAAQKSADDLRDAARAESENAYREAEKRARDIVRDALAEKQRILDEVERLRASTEAFRSEYMAVLSRFTSEAQKVMPTIKDAMPDIADEKKATADAIRVIREGDAAFKAPAFEPVAAEPLPAAVSSAFDAAANSGYRSAPVQTSQAAPAAQSAQSAQTTRAREIPSRAAQPAQQAAQAAGRAAQSAPLQATQPAFEMDEDLDIDIEEID